MNGLLAGDSPPDQISAVEANPRYQVVGGKINKIRNSVWDKYNPALARQMRKDGTNQTASAQIRWPFQPHKSTTLQHPYRPGPRRPPAAA